MDAPFVDTPSGPARLFPVVSCYSQQVFVPFGEGFAINCCQAPRMRASVWGQHRVCVAQTSPLLFSQRTFIEQHHPDPIEQLLLSRFPAKTWALKQCPNNPYPINRGGGGSPP